MKLKSHKHFLKAFVFLFAPFWVMANGPSSNDGERDPLPSLTLNQATNLAVDGGSISDPSGQTEFTTVTGDGKSDVVYFTNNSNATNSYIYLITDINGNILVTEQSSHDFEGASVGICKIYGLSYTGRLNVRGKNVKDSGLATGKFSLSSNSMVITREKEVNVVGGTLKGGPYTFCIDGETDNVSGVALSGNSGSNSTWIITDDKLNILGLPPTLEAVEGVDFDPAGGGTCLIWHISYEGELVGRELGLNAADLQGTFDLSNSLTVTRNEPEGGEITGGPFEFTIDGTSDMVSGLGLSGNSGSNSAWIITDEELNILGLPPTLEAVEGVDFDPAGVGTCLIWHISFEDGLTGVELGMNAADLSGCYDLSNSIAVVRTPADPTVDGGTLKGGPYTFCIDGETDNVSGVALSGNSGSNSTWIITDDKLNILGLPPTLEAVEGVDFDPAGVGTCLIWHISYEGELVGRELGLNAADLQGTFDLSNSLTVTRNEPEGGEITGGPFEFTIDGTSDMVSGLGLSGNSGSNSAWIITDEELNILGLPPTLEAVEGVDFDPAGVGTCLIWHISFEDGLTGVELGMNAADLSGCYDLSNSIAVVRTPADPTVDGGTLEGGPYTFCIDGETDNVSGVALSGNSGSNSTWIITDDKLNILGLPPTLEAVEGVDFDPAGGGTCLIWHISYEGELVGRELGLNAADLQGTFDLSNSLTVTRNEPEGGEITGGPFEFTIDGTSDMVSGLGLSGNSGSNSAWIITDEELNILGLPPTLEAVEGVDFDPAGVGTCLIWHISFEDGLTGVELGMNAADLSGCYDLSNSIAVVRTPADPTVDGGTLEGGPYTFCIDGETDNVSGVALSGNSGSNSTWIITDDKLNILGLPPTLEAVEGVDFDPAGVGTCLIWHISYEGELVGRELGLNAADLQGTFDLSNSLTVTRNEPEGGEITGGPFEFTIDGTSDMVSGLGLSGNSGSNSAWIITDEELNI